MAQQSAQYVSIDGRAVDVAPYVGGISWDWQHYYPLAEHVKTVWQRLQQDGKTTGQYKLTWGGDWSSFRDGPHWQLDAICTGSWMRSDMSTVVIVSISAVLLAGGGFLAGRATARDGSADVLTAQSETLDTLLDGQTEILTAASRPMVIDAEIRDKLADTPPACIAEPLGLACSLQACWQYGHLRRSVTARRVAGDVGTVSRRVERPSGHHSPENPQAFERVDRRSTWHPFGAEVSKADR
jgi:hypothetical protein